jgi:hypothetical protein
MVTYKELRRRLDEATSEPIDIYDLFEEWFQLLEDSTFYIYRTDTKPFWRLIFKVLKRQRRRRVS